MHMCVYHFYVCLCMLCSATEAGGVRPSGAGVAGSCEALDVGPLQGQHHLSSLCVCTHVQTRAWASLQVAALLQGAVRPSCQRGLDKE